MTYFAYPLTPRCQIIFEKKEHICLGISPYNSLFSQEYISSLIKWAQENFNSFHLFFPDTPTLYTLEALGYTGCKARQKLKKQINWLRNKILKALEENGISQEFASSYILDAQSLESNPIYLAEREKVLELFEKDALFNRSCMEASRWVLENKILNGDIQEEKLKSAVKYFLFELPLFAATNKIVNKESSAFCYHQSIIFHDSLYNNKLAYLPDDQQGYCMIQEIL